MALASSSAPGGRRLIGRLTNFRLARCELDGQAEASDFRQFVLIDIRQWLIMLVTSHENGIDGYGASVVKNRHRLAG